MRVIFKIVTGPKTTATSGSARYITDRDRNPKLEAPATRTLYTPHDDLIKWNAANSYLSGKPTARPRTADLHHLVLSFDKEDAKDLERFDGSDRDRPYRLITRQAMSKIAERLNVSGVKWVAGVHRHTPHPHIHLILHKDATDPSTGDPKRITRFPREMLNDRDEKGAPVAGIVNLEFSRAIDGLLRRERKPEGGDRDNLTTQNPGGSDRPTARIGGSQTEVHKLVNDHRPAAASHENPEAPAPDHEPAQGPTPASTPEHPSSDPIAPRAASRPSLIDHMRLLVADEPHAPETPQQPPLTTAPTPTQPSPAPADQNPDNDQSPTAHFLGNGQPDSTCPPDFSEEKFQAEPRNQGDDRAADFISPAPNPYISPTPDEVSAREQVTQQQPADLDDSFDLDF